MTKPSNFIENSDYASLKNDDTVLVSVAITDSGLLAYGASKVYESFVTVGIVNAGLRVQMYSSATPNDIWNCMGMTVPVTVTVTPGGTTFSYNLPVVVERVSPTQMRIYSIFFSNGVGVSMRITSGYQTITADIATFLSPFN
jgi:hypothetical protein